MRKWRLPLTYQPKIEPVKKGDCRQTIRIGRKKQVGDLIRFFIWTGRPYWSKQTTITEYTLLIEVVPIAIERWGIIWCDQSDRVELWEDLDWLAALDGIVPPTGKELRTVLFDKNDVPEGGIDAHILRW